jgi:hypothetical protein
MQFSTVFAKTGLSVALGTALALTGFAQTFVEPADAGQTVAAATPTGDPGTPLSTITGTLTPAGFSTTDVDFFLINVVDPKAFSASTVNLATGSLDTVLFLLGTDGSPILLNDDDAGGLTVASTIPAGSLSIAAQVVILGVSVSGIEPVTPALQALFESGLASTDLRGPNPTLTDVLGGFSDAGAGNVGGKYQIDLLGAEAVPETSTALGGTVALGLAALTLARRRSSGNQA